MFDIIVLFGTIIGSVLFRKMASRKTRDIITPWALAYYFVVICAIGSVQEEGGLIHFLFTSMNFVPVMIMCDGFNAFEGRGNPAWQMFLVFYTYMCIIGMTGYVPVSGVLFYVQTLLNTFMSGFFLARWVCRTEGGLRKLLTPMLVAACVCVVYYVYFHRALTSELDVYGRLDTVSDEWAEDSKVNQNGVALRMCAILPFLIISLFYLRGKLMVVGMVALLLLGLVLVRTGSRNGALALLACGWYFLNSSTNKRVLYKRMALSALVVILFAIGVFMTNKGVNAIRAFDFKNKEVERIYGAGIESMTTGRWSMWALNLSLFSAKDIMLGKGCANSEYTTKGVKVERFRGENAHSIYMTIFYRTGIVGSMLFIAFVFMFFGQAGKLGVRGKLAKFFMLTWLLTGVGESWGMNGGALGLLAGFAVGLISLRPAQNPEFGEIPTDYRYWGP